MVMKEEFEIFISKDGKIKMTAKGFSGNECQQPLKRITDILSPDGKIIDKGTTWEFHQAEVEAIDSVKISGTDETKRKR